ncbi:MAG: V-type ATP synthase subunit A, partial [Synergistaceae bacterium]|nr:V-type ATP synthase subunit A [Synergistaceae bacterium]
MDEKMDGNIGGNIDGNTDGKIDESKRLGTLTAINGPVVQAVGTSHFAMRELVRVGNLGLTGEILQMDGDRSVIQVYEDTGGIRPGEPVRGWGRPLSICLGPGLIGHIIDGIGRPLDRLMAKEGSFHARGTHLDAVDMDRTWEATPMCKVGDMLSPGMAVVTVKETDLIQNRVVVPQGVEGEVEFVAPPGFYRTSEVMARIRTAERKIVPVMMFQYWPVRTPRPY